MKTYTICGSMRFEKEMQKIAYDLERCKGYNILQCVYGEKNIFQRRKSYQDLQKRIIEK